MIKARSIIKIISGIRIGLLATKLVHLCFFTAVIFCFLPQAYAEVITADTLWQGTIDLQEDVLVSAGVTLSIAPGTKITIKGDSSLNTDPEFLAHQTEILVRGKLLVQGENGSPVSFSSEKAGQHDNRWAGIIVDGGLADLKYCNIGGAETGVYVINGKVFLLGAVIEGNRYGIVSHGGRSEVVAMNSFVRKNDYGVMQFNGGFFRMENSQILHNLKKDLFETSSKLAKLTPKAMPDHDKQLVGVNRVYKNETLLGETVWQGLIRVEGQVRLAEEGRLIIMPGTVVEFSKNDSNADGIGENGLMLQGVLLAKGTPAAPIIFRSAENEPAMGDWDAINILGSDKTRNLIEFCQIEHAYRGMHFHFSNVAITNSVIRRNFRGAQFQESVVEIRDSQFYLNKSAIQARDSDVSFQGNQVYGNINGAYFYRLNLEADGNIFANNRWEGLRIREGAAKVEHNIMAGNRFGMQVADAVFGKFNNNLLADNIEAGLSLKNTDNIEILGNAVLANGLNGIIVRDSRGVIQGNLISANRERGIGILSFNGKLTKNNFADNGLYAIGLEGSGDISAEENWWSSSDLKKEIYDQNDDKNLGLVTFEPKLDKPMMYSWPVNNVPVDLAWTGDILVEEDLTVPVGAILSIAPGTNIKFAEKKGMNVYGRIEAKGEADRRITFSGINGKGPLEWGEIALERAMDSSFVNCDFRNASFAIHSHYVNLKVSRCLFENNDGGLRFNSGPVLVEESIFRKNRIGMRSYRGTGIVSRNELTSNEIAIYVREMGSGMKFMHNNIFKNERYNMRLGDFNNEDVDARNNWWGGGSVVETFFDGNVESYIGKVIYQPVLDKPINVELNEPLASGSKK